MNNPALFGQVKRKLNVTWDDDDTTARIEEIIESAIPTMLHKLGIADPDFDFSVPGMENNLFLSYCLYDWNHCTNEFDDNYANNIGQVREKHELDQYSSESEGGTDGEA
jgi:hypothetical protein